MGSQDKSSSKDNYLAEEVRQLNEKLMKLQSENARLLDIIKDNDLEDEVEDIVTVSPEMEVCLKGINQILERVRNGTHDNNDVKDFDILHKNLRMIKGLEENTKKKKSKPAKVEDLLKIVNGKGS